MAKKTEDIESESKDTQEEGPAVDKPQKPCGHVNRHHVDLDGEPSTVNCELPAGHGGDHQADYVCYRQTNGSTKQAKQIAQAKLEGRAIVIVLSGKEFIETTEKTYWSDGASIPVENIHPDLEQLADIKQRKGNMLDEAQILRKKN